VGKPLLLNYRYMLDEFLADAMSGHNILGTVFVDAHAMYRTTGPDSMKSLGEVEFAAGVAAMAESGVFGPIRVAAGIVGHPDLRLGEKVEEVLHAHVQAAGGRYRGVRNLTAHSPDPGLAYMAANNPPHVLADRNYRAGIKVLGKMGLACDIWIFYQQLPDLVDLARAHPDTQFILDHMGPSLNIFGQKAADTVPVWKKNLADVAKCPNVAVKVGGLGLPIYGFKSYMSDPPASSEQLAAEWKPYVEVCVEAFGVDRCMFESNFPVDAGGANYPVLWNAFKRITAGYSKDEKAALFAGTARKVYKLTI
jgi:predicted TIM-barrel fold metal-dependent hydrolase